MSLNLDTPRRLPPAISVSPLLQARLGRSERCPRCRQWSLQAAEIGDYGKVSLLDVGRWLPGTGLQIDDDLFPHVTGGFRGRTIPIMSLEVSGWGV